nr:12970_t:CDS:2 [Entrophospora candida]
MPKSRRPNYVTMKFALDNRNGRSGGPYNNRPSTTTNNKDNNFNIVFSLNEGGIDDDKLLENPPYKIHFSSIEELISPSTKSRSYNKSQKDPTAKIYIPRPQNEFMLFRKNYSKGLKNQKKSNRRAEGLNQLYQQQLFQEFLFFQQFQNQYFDQSQQYPQIQYAQLQCMPDVMITSPEECLIPDSAVESSPTSTNFSELESPEIEYCQYSSIYDSPLFPEIDLLLTTVKAGVFTTSPFSKTIWTAGATEIITWKDDGNDTSIQTFVRNVANDVDANTEKFTYAVPSDVGPEGQYASKPTLTPTPLSGGGSIFHINNLTLEKVIGETLFYPFFYNDQDYFIVRKMKHFLRVEELSLSIVGITSEKI